jgi:hypothetical protein
MFVDRQLSSTAPMNYGGYPIFGAKASEASMAHSGPTIYGGPFNHGGSAVHALQSGQGGSNFFGGVSNHGGPSFYGGPFNNEEGTSFLVHLQTMVGLILAE